MTSVDENVTPNENLPVRVIAWRRESGCSQIFAKRLVLPYKRALPENIGITSSAANDAVFSSNRLSASLRGLGTPSSLHRSHRSHRSRNWLRTPCTSMSAYAGRPGRHWVMKDVERLGLNAPQHAFNSCLCQPLGWRIQTVNQDTQQRFRNDQQIERIPHKLAALDANQRLRAAHPGRFGLCVAVRKAMHQRVAVLTRSL